MAPRTFCYQLQIFYMNCTFHCCSFCSIALIFCFNRGNSFFAKVRETVLFVLYTCSISYINTIQDLGIASACDELLICDNVSSDTKLCFTLQRVSVALATLASDFLPKTPISTFPSLKLFSPVSIQSKIYCWWNGHGQIKTLHEPKLNMSTCQNDILRLLSLLIRKQLSNT